MKERKKRDSTSSSAKMSLLLFFLNEKAINWRRDNLEKNDKSLILLPFLFPVILYCRKDYTKRSFLVYTIKCVLCARAYAHTHKRSFPAFSLIDVTSPLPGRVALMYNMVQLVCVCQKMCTCASLLNTHTYT